jgi:hypothetical protein
VRFVERRLEDDYDWNLCWARVVVERADRAANSRHMYLCYTARAGCTHSTPPAEGKGIDRRPPSVMGIARSSLAVHMCTNHDCGCSASIHWSCTIDMDYHRTDFVFEHSFEVNMT